mmetsp:Transcript_158922/g.509757  ORF Transcript_158922/g.509757 Transcript_158922/m.509757 type:complete len:212 (+) Transcript_158922:1968-2603(+)
MSMDSERSDHRPAEFDDPGGEGRRALQPARADVVDSAKSGVSGSACVSSVTEALGDNLLMVEGVLTVPTAWQSSPQKPAVPDNFGRGACSCLTREMSDSALPSSSSETGLHKFPTVASKPATTASPRAEPVGDVRAIPAFGESGRPPPRCGAGGRSCGGDHSGAVQSGACACGGDGGRGAAFAADSCRPADPPVSLAEEGSTPAVPLTLVR